jgi:hypothetical protein
VHNYTLNTFDINWGVKASMIFNPHKSRKNVNPVFILDSTSVLCNFVVYVKLLFCLT